MRLQLNLLVFLVPWVALSAPKEIGELLKTSQKYRLEISTEKSQEKKAQQLLKLEKELNATLKEYEKIHPEEGGAAEESVAKFSYSLEPALVLAAPQKISPKNCKKAKHQIEFEDKGSRSEDAVVTPDAQEALAWVALLCGS